MTYSFWNEWRWVTADIFDVTLIRASVSRFHGRYYVELVILGFGMAVRA